MLHIIASQVETTHQTSLTRVLITSGPSNQNQNDSDQM